MKKLDLIMVASAAFFYASSASAQNTGTLANHAVAVGKGAGFQGYTGVIPGTAGLPFISNGATSDPSFQVLPNSGLAQMPATTVKCNSTTALANAQDCTAPVIGGSLTSTQASGSALVASGANAGLELGNKVAVPVNGALTATAGGTLAATTYYVRSTWAGPWGETLGATETSLAVAVNNVLNVAAPASPPTGATGWNVYVSTAAGSETRQNGATPIALGTAWVEPTTGLVSGAGLPSNTPFIYFHNTSSNIAYDSSITPFGGNGTAGGGGILLTGSVQINALPSSTASGLNINQTASGSVGASNSLNQFTILSDNMNVLGNFNNGFEVYHSFGGTATQGGRQAVFGYLTNTAATNASNPNRNYVGGAFVAAAQVGDGGTGTTMATGQGAFFGLNPVGRAFNGATNLLEVAGLEVNFGLATGSSAAYKAGITIANNSDDAVQGATYDTAIGISAQTSASGGLKDLILIGNMNGAYPGASTGNIIRTIGGSQANGIDFSATSFSGSPFKSLNFSVNSVGQVFSSGFNTNSAPTSAPSLYVGSSSVTIANGANALLSAGAGFILVRNANNNHHAIYLVGAGTGSLVVQIGTEFVAPTATPAAGNISVAYDGTASAYRIYNNFGSSVTFVVGAINTGGV